MATTPIADLARTVWAGLDLVPCRSGTKWNKGTTSQVIHGRQRIRQCCLRVCQRLFRTRSGDPTRRGCLVTIARGSARLRACTPTQGSALGTKERPCPLTICFRRRRALGASLLLSARFPVAACAQKPTRSLHELQGRLTIGEIVYVLSSMVHDSCVARNRRLMSDRAQRLLGGDGEDW
jgi:hypothetical protein